MGNPKKIVFVLNSLKAGGSERVFWLISNYFAKHFETTLVVINSDNAFFNDFEEELKIIHLNAPRASKGLFKLLTTIRQIQPDAIFVTGTHLNIWIGLLSFFIKPTQLFARESSITNQMKMHLTKHYFRAKVVLSLIKFIYPKFDKIICQSIGMKNSMMNHYGLLENKLTIISNPIQYTSLINTRQPNETIKLVTIGRFSPEKGHIRLIEAMAKLSNNFSLDIYGSGHLENVLLEKIKELNLEQRVKICGQSKNAKETLIDYDALILTSFTEGFPNVVLESLSVGTPVIAYQVSGVDEMINDNNGFVIEQGDETSLLNTIRKLTTKNWNKLQIKHECIEKFEIEKIFELYKNLFSK